MAPKKPKSGTSTRSNSINQSNPQLTASPSVPVSDNDTDAEEDELRIEGINIETASNHDMLKFLCKQSLQMKKMQKEIDSLKVQVKKRDSTINTLESRIHELEQTTRLDNLVISGIECQHRSYARVAGNSNSADQNEHAPSQEQQTLESSVVLKLKEYNIPISESDISTCHTLGQRGPNGKSNILIKLCNRKTKINILQHAKQLKGSNIYINEHLTKQNAAIAKEARVLRKQKKIESTWTRNCRVFIKFSPDGEHSKIAAVTNLDELKKFY